MNPLPLPEIAALRCATKVTPSDFRHVLDTAAAFWKARWLIWRLCNDCQTVEKEDAALEAARAFLSETEAGGGDV